MSKSIPLFTFFCLSLTCMAMSATNKKSSIHGGMSNVMVWFDPYVSNIDISIPNAYTQSDLIPLIAKIHTRFKKIMMVDIKQNHHEEQTTVYIPAAVAKFNRDHLKPGEPHMELFMTFELSGNESIRHFDVVKGLADQANTIYYGTVRKILLDYTKLSTDTVDTTKENLIYAESKIQSSRIPYELGAILPQQDCGSDRSRVEGYLQPLLPHLHFILFSMWTNEADIKRGPKPTLQRFARRFNDCKKKIQKDHSIIEVGIRTSWPDTGKDGVENITKMVDYWELFDDWAGKTNTTVCFHEAFDNPFKSEDSRHDGWWKLDESIIYDNTSQYVFIEKKSVRTLKKTSPLPTKGESPSDSSNLTNIILLSVTIGIIALLIVMLTIFILYKRMMMKMANSCLTREELKEFFDGGGSSIGQEHGFGMGGIANMAYDKKLDINIDAFSVDEKSVLGIGTFGVVYHGSIVNSLGLTQEAAVKTPKHAGPVSALKGLLAEIKVLSYLGQHDNIVNIIGAYTPELIKGKLYVFIELCGLGSLEKYLRTKQLPRYVDVDEPSAFAPLLYQNNPSNIAQPLMSDLNRWSYEVASGMEFLTSKHVVHADLATRNILLTSEKVAKISDFGLSRRLYDYTNYVKTQQEPLPWRWMAPESLRRLEFNEKTDVWAFGITLWEIYTLGDIPYPGLSWTTDFPFQLEHGLRVQKPEHCSEETYNNIRRCCNINPSERPTFFELKGLLT